MIEQSEPCGQHNVAVMSAVVFNCKQVVSCGQQKLDGKAKPHC
jgi:hypothetical protein